MRAGSGPGSVNWELGTGLRGWDPDCFRGHRELWEFQGWDPDCFSGNGGLRGQAEACSGKDEVEGGKVWKVWKAGPLGKAR